MKTRIFFLNLKRVIAGIMAFALVSQSAFALPLTFTVDDTGDVSDAAAGNGVCDTGGGVCTFRAAIEEADARPLAEIDTIDFSIGAANITIGSNITISTGDFAIQNTSGSKVGLDGNNGAYEILTINGDTITIDGNDNLYFYNSGDNGISIGANAEDITITDVVIGLNTGDIVDANAGQGVWIMGDDVTISSSVISGNTGSGIYGKDSLSDVTIDSNKIGTDSTGTLDLGNGGNGIQFDAAATAVDFDGDADGSGGIGLNITNNVISGNTSNGVAIGNASNDTAGTITISGNKIGTNVDGDTAIANDGMGINGYEAISADWIISGNVISSNAGEGINLNNGTAISISGNQIGFNADADAALGNGSSGIAVDGVTVTITNNDIGNNTGKGINADGTDDLVTLNITNNRIGYSTTAPDTDFGNTSNGVWVNPSSGSVTLNMNADLSSTPNIISYNDSSAVSIGNGSGVVAATLTGNIFGLKEVTGAYNGVAANGGGINVNSSVLTSLVIGGADGTDDPNLVYATGDAYYLNISDTDATANIDIQNNKFGVGASGAEALTGPNFSGIVIADGADIDFLDNIVGNSLGRALEFTGGVDITLQGNKIGIGDDGSTPLGNGSDGILFNSDVTTTLLIGTNGDGTSDNTEGNVVVDNTGVGIYVQNLASSAATVTVKGNFVGIAGDGVNITGMTNGGNGIQIDEGALVLGGDNYLENNDGETHEDAESNANVVGEGNVVSNNTSYGLVIGSSVSSATIYGNIIGLKKDQVGAAGIFNVDAGNGDTGIYLSSANSLATFIVGAVGDTLTASKRNVISGNTGAGIDIGSSDDSATITIKNNYIGTDITGTVDVGNAGNGNGSIGINIDLDGSPTINIGGTSANEGNVISGNGSAGIYVNPSIATVTTNILGNKIGTNALGTADLGNDGAGVNIVNTGGTVNIGNGASGGGNVISGNTGAGIIIDGGTISILGNIVGLLYDVSEAAYITAASNGATDLVADVFDSGGILALGGSLTIGGGDYTDANSRNVVSGNVGYGIGILAADSLTISGNYVGLGSDGADHNVGNTQDLSDGSGIWLLNYDDLDGAIVGGASTNAGNVIADNEGHGIFVSTEGYGGSQGTMDWIIGYIDYNIIGQDINGNSSPNVDTTDADDEYGIYVTDADAILANLRIGSSTNTIETSTNYGVYLNEVSAGALTGGYSAIATGNDFSDPATYSWQYVLNGVSQLTHECEDGVDNNSNGLIDSNDLGCRYAPFVEGNTSGDPVASEDGGAGFGGGAPAAAAPVAAPVATVNPTIETQDPDSVAEPVAEMIDEISETPDVAEVPVEVFEVDYSVTEDVAIETIVEAMSEQEGITDMEVDHVVDKYIEEIKKLEKSAESGETVVETEQQKETKKVKEAANKITRSEVLSEEERSEVKTIVDKTSQESLSQSIDKKGGTVTVKSEGQNIEIKSGEKVEVVWKSLTTEEERVEKQKKAQEEGIKVIETDFNEDLDGDGLPNLIELEIETSIWADKVEGGELSDADIYFVGKEIPERPKITSPANKTTSNSPSLWLAGQPGDLVEVIAVNADTVSLEELKTLTLSKVTLASNSSQETSGKINLGKVTIDDKYKGVLIPEYLPEGRWYIVIKGDQGIGEVSEITVDKNSGEIRDPKITGYKKGSRTDCELKAIFNWLKLTPEVDLDCVFVEDEEPGIISAAVEPGTIVQVTWHSVILNSVVIADASQGEVEIEVPADLPEGEHEVVVYSYDPVSEVMSGISRYLFTY